MYHSISQTRNKRFSPFAVPPEQFAEQMICLEEGGYKAYTVTAYRQAWQRGGLAERAVVLTFDDGYADFFEAALPILRRHKFEATLYVTTGFVGESSRWLMRERETQRAMLSWEQLQEIDRSGIECGGHTQSHVALDSVTEARAKWEIESCKEKLQEHLGHKVHSFAYPFGYSTGKVRQLVARAGYSTGCVVGHGLSKQGSDHYALRRLMIRPGTSIESFKKLLEGTGISWWERIYLRMRTPAWRLLRQSAVAMGEYFQRGRVGR
jgi:peptidoglycan/xylan/chitin deacetylase (PgdA/CDA1 family)